MNSSSTIAMQPIEPLDLSTITMPASTLPKSIYTLSNSASAIYSYDPNAVFTNGSTGMTITGNSTISVKGKADFEDDIFIKGKSLTVTLSKIEERLAILHPNKNLEQKWDELKELGRLYRELEKDILEQEKIVEILKR